MNYFYSLLSLILFMGIAHAEPNTLWSDVSSETARQSLTLSKLPLLPDSYRLLRLEEEKMREKLNEKNNFHSAFKTGRKTEPLKIPLPSGEFLSLQFEENQVMASELAAKYPQIKTYIVESKKNNGIYGVLDITEHGFHAMLFMHDGSRLFIDPRKITGGETFYISYYDKHYHPSGKKPFKCEVKSHNHDQQSSSLIHKTVERSGAQLRTYRLAMAATGEYTAFHGGTIPGALAGITTTVSRVNAIFQRDLAIKLELVANTDLLIRTDTTTYSNGDGGAMLGENQLQVDSIIGSINYDIGHVVSTGGGGVAFLRATCNNALKAGGVTGSSSPQSDAFDIDFVAHELGHQFGGNHTFNSTTGSCDGGNRNPGTAFEPGSGSTIMAYAGICGSNDIQPHSDAMFHIESISEMGSFIDNAATGGSCGTDSSLSNQQPVSNAGSDYIIPINTPFVLVGTGSDADGDSLSYSWEQVDSGAASDRNVDTSDNAVFRSFLPQATPARIFPTLDSILNNTISKGETLSVNARDLNFSFAVRDNIGGVATDQMVVTVAGLDAFRITSHTTPETLVGSDIEITWDVANTNAAPVNCAEVNILFSTDAGSTFTNVSGGATLNDGSQSITIPPSIVDSTTGRFKIECTNNIFFDISDADLTTVSQLNAQPVILSNLGSNEVVDPGETIQLIIPLRNNSSALATEVSATLSSLDEEVDLIDLESAYPDIPVASQADNTVPYLIQIPTDYVCGKDIPLTLNTSFTLDTQINKVFDLVVPVGAATSESQANLDSQSIPDAPASGISSQILLSGLGKISKPAINIDIDISHTYRGDLEIFLTSPNGTTVQLKESSAGDGINDVIGNFPTDFIPKESLSAFDGENLDGHWTLVVIDRLGGDIGTLNSWTLNFNNYICDVITNPDSDGDGFADDIDNCPNQPNPRQSDEDGNGQGDMCTPHLLENNKWHQISMPANVNNATVEDVFVTESLLSIEYGDKWTLFEYDVSDNLYRELELIDELVLGKGYWIIQFTGNTIDINIPLTAQETSVQNSTQCSSLEGCFEVALPVAVSDTQWSMLGYPFEHSLNTLGGVRIVTNSGICSDGCTLNEASDAQIVQKDFWNFNGVSYDKITATDGIINSWEGVWMNTLEGANGLNARLLIPLP